MTTSLRRRCLAELLGTALLVGIGTGAVVAAAGAGGAPPWVLAVAWFAAVTIPVWMFAPISGAHLNPAVSLAMASDGRLPIRELPSYVGAQVAGAFLGSATVYFSLGRRANLGSSVPATGALAPTILAELAFTFLLVLVILALVPRGVTRRDIRLLLPGAVVGASTLLIGSWTGSALNPARALAPAVLTGTYGGLWVFLVFAPLAALAAIPVARWLLPRHNLGRRISGARGPQRAGEGGPEPPVAVGPSDPPDPPAGI